MKYRLVDHMSPNDGPYWVLYNGSKPSVVNAASPEGVVRVLENMLADAKRQVPKKPRRCWWRWNWL